MNKLLNIAVVICATYILYLVGYSTYVHVDRSKPVVDNMEADVVSRNGDQLLLSVKGRKIKNCKLVSNSWSVLYHSSGQLYESPERLKFPNDATPDSSRPDSDNLQDFGLFLLTVPMEADAVLVTVEHLCNTDSTPRLTTVLEKSLRVPN